MKNSYGILGISLDDNNRPALYTNQIDVTLGDSGQVVLWSLSHDWKSVWKNSACSFYLISVTLLPFGSILGISNDPANEDIYELWLAINYKVDSLEWVKIEYTTFPSQVGLRSVTIMNDRTMLAVGADNQLYTCSSYPQNQAIWEFIQIEGSGDPGCITVLQDGKICCNWEPDGFTGLRVTDPPPAKTDWVDQGQGLLYSLAMNDLSVTQDGSILGVSKSSVSSGTNLYATNQSFANEWSQVRGGESRQLISAWACWALP